MAFVRTNVRTHERGISESSLTSVSANNKFIMDRGTVLCTCYNVMKRYMTYFIYTFSDFQETLDEKENGKWIPWRGGEQRGHGKGRWRGIFGKLMKS